MDGLQPWYLAVILTTHMLLLIFINYSLFINYLLSQVHHHGDFEFFILVLFRKIFIQYTVLVRMKYKGWAP